MTVVFISYIINRRFLSWSRSRSAVIPAKQPPLIRAPRFGLLVTTSV